MFVSSSFAYCNHLVNGISLGLAQSDPIKRRILYKLAVKHCIFFSIIFRQSFVVGTEISHFNKKANIHNKL